MKIQTKRDIEQRIRKWCHVFKKWHLFVKIQSD